MPFYKLVCRDCGKTFEIRAAVAEREEKRLACPSCGGKALENDYSAGAPGYQIKSNPGTVCPHHQECGCGCMHGVGGNMSCGG